MEAFVNLAIAVVSFLGGATQHTGACIPVGTVLNIEGPPPYALHLEQELIPKVGLLGDPQCESLG